MHRDMFANKMNVLEYTMSAWFLCIWYRLKIMFFDSPINLSMKYMCKFHTKSTHMQLLAQSKRKYMLLKFVIWNRAFEVTIYLDLYVKTCIVLMNVTHKISNKFIPTNCILWIETVKTNEKSVLKNILLVTRWYINKIIDFNYLITTVIRFFQQKFTLL